MLAVLGVPQMLSSYFDLRARRQAEERRWEEQRQGEERRRQDLDAAERRHQEIMTLLIASLNNGSRQETGQSELVRTLQQTVTELQAENERLRQQNGNGSSQSP